MDFGRVEDGEMENEGRIGLIRVDGNCEENEAQIGSFGREAEQQVKHVTLHLLALRVIAEEDTYAVDYDVK